MENASGKCSLNTAFCYYFIIITIIMPSQRPKMSGTGFIVKNQRALSKDKSNNIIRHLSKDKMFQELYKEHKLI